jgi:hypothetical protein
MFWNKHIVGFKTAPPPAHKQIHFALSHTILRAHFVSCRVQQLATASNIKPLRLETERRLRPPRTEPDRSFIHISCPLQQISGVTPTIDQCLHFEEAMSPLIGSTYYKSHSYFFQPCHKVSANRVIYQYCFKIPSGRHYDNSQHRNFISLSITYQPKLLPNSCQQNFGMFLDVMRVRKLKENITTTFFKYGK